MKKILLTVSTAAILLAACNTEKKDPLSTDKQVVFTDTSSMKKTDVSTDIPVAGANTAAAAPAPQSTAPKPEVRTVTKIVTVHDAPPAKAPAPVPAVPAANPPVATSTTTTASTEPASTGTVTTAGNTTAATTPAPVPAKKKTGWSGAAKDATIGGVGGAVVGGVIGKGAKGAIIGGVIGAAGGYIIGRKSDKKADSTNNP